MRRVYYMRFSFSSSSTVYGSEGAADRRMVFQPWRYIYIYELFESVQLLHLRLWTQMSNIWCYCYESVSFSISLLTSLSSGGMCIRVPFRFSTQHQNTSAPSRGCLLPLLMGFGSISRPKSLVLSKSDGVLANSGMRNMGNEHLRGKSSSLSF